MHINNWIFIVFFVFLSPSSSGGQSLREVQSKVQNTNKKNTLDKRPEGKKSQSKKTKRRTKQGTKNSSHSINSSVIKSLTNELDFLNKKLNPRLKEKEAVDYMKHDKNKKAINLLESLEDSSPRSLMILAQAYENTGDYDNQIRVLRKLIKKNKKNGTYLIELAKGLKNLYFKTGLFQHREEAVKTIDQVLTLHKKYHEKAQLEMLTLLKYKEDSEETNYAILKLLQKMLREFGVKKSYIKDICKYFYINKFYKQSLSGCKKAIKYDPKEPSNYIYHALSMEILEDTEKHLKKTVKKFPKSTFAHIKTGLFLLEQKEYKSALPYFKTVLSKKPHSAEGQLGLAQSLFHTGKEKKSYKHFLKACMLNKPQMLWAFKQAKSILNQKSKFKLASFFERGITQCFLKAKHNK